MFRYWAPEDALVFSSSGSDSGASLTFTNTATNKHWSVAQVYDVSFASACQNDDIFRDNEKTTELDLRMDIAAAHFTVEIWRTAEAFKRMYDHCAGDGQSVP